MTLQPTQTDPGVRAPARPRAAWRSASWRIGYRVEGIRHAEPGRVVERPEHDECPPDHSTLRDRPDGDVAAAADVVLARVPGVRAVVAHDPEAILGHGDVEGLVARQVGQAVAVGVHIRLVERVS